MTTPRQPKSLHAELVAIARRRTLRAARMVAIGADPVATAEALDEAAWSHALATWPAAGPVLVPDDGPPDDAPPSALAFGATYDDSTRK